jgi:hypothetical protein
VHTLDDGRLCSPNDEQHSWAAGALLFSPRMEMKEHANDRLAVGSVGALRTRGLVPVAAILAEEILNMSRVVSSTAFRPGSCVLVWSWCSRVTVPLHSPDP